MTLRHRTTRLFTVGAVALVTAATACLVGIAPTPASAATKTFVPKAPRTYLQDVTVTSTPKAWKFAIRTKKPKQVIGYELYLDIGPTGRDEEASADYILQSVLGDTRLYKSYDGTREVSESANCAGKRTKPLTGAAGPGRLIVIPQQCLLNFDAAAGTTGGTVSRLRVRVAVIGAPPGQNCVYNWSPRRGRTVFHGWVRNHPDAPAVSTQPERPVATAGAVSARRGC